MSRLLIGVSALLGFVLPIQAQPKDDTLPADVIARLGEVHYQNVGRAFSVAFSPDGKTFASGAWDGSIRLWDLATGKELRQYTGHKGWVRSVAFSFDGKMLASGGKDKIVRLWETATGKELRRLEGHRNWIQYVAFSPDGKTLASHSTYRTLCLWDVTVGRKLRQIDLHWGAAASFAFSPDSKLLAYGDMNGIALLDIAAGKEVRQFTVPHSWFGGLAFAPDGKTLSGANYNADFTIHMWDTATGKRLRPLGKLEGGMGSIAYSLDGRSMASTGENRSLHLWEVISRRERCQFRSTDNTPWALAFSPNGRILAQGSDDITVLLWDVTGLRKKDQLRPTMLSPKELQTLWTELARADAAAAHRAIWKMTAGSKDSVPFIQEHLQPVSPADNRLIARLVADLDSDRFETRRQATEQLEKWGELAEPFLRDALRDRPPLERRQRVNQLLEKVASDRENPSPDRLRMLRVLEVLEHMNTPAGRQTLEKFAKGAAAADLTKEANAVLKRLAGYSGY